MTNTPATKYNMGWLQCAFVAPKNQKREYTRFCAVLKKLGWLKMQAGLWMRPFVRVSETEKYRDAIVTSIPFAANIKVMYITDKQWGDSVTLFGKNFP